jgi:sigma-B regulation protein RsbU (phosphoserine phosphatase)
MIAQMPEVPEQPTCTRHRVLIADDQPDVLEALRLLLKNHGYEVITASSPAGILSRIDSENFDLVLMDLNYGRDTTSGREGIELLERLSAREEKPPIVVMTGWASVGLAVEAMHQGVADFIEKPWTNTRLLEILAKQITIGSERRTARERSRARSREDEQQRVALRRAQDEMEEALRIQQRLLPAQIPQAAGYEIAAIWRPARIIGGDYYDVLRLGQDTLAFCIADVAGHGLPAALVMANLQAAVHGFASIGLAPHEMCEGLNRVLCENLSPDRFVTFFYAVLNTKSGRLQYSNAGHPSPLVSRIDGSSVSLQGGGPVLGLFPEERFTTQEVQLIASDRLVCFTDGVLEASGADGLEFGQQGLRETVCGRVTDSAEALSQGLLQAALLHAQGSLEDDATVLTVAVRGN